MGIKKIARPINSAKNLFLRYLMSRGALHVDIYEGSPSPEWDYYRYVSAFIGDTLINVYFQMWQGDICIKYDDEENVYDRLSIEEFLTLIQ